MGKAGVIMILSRFFSQKHKFSGAFVFILTAVILTLTACSMKEESGTVLLKDGTVDSVIVENFDKSYYDKDELQQAILEEAASYNRTMGREAVSVNKIVVEDGRVTVKMSYACSDDYGAFNNGIFFDGSIQDAQAAGYDLNKVFSSVTDELATVGMSDVLAMTDMKILITDMKEPVNLNGKAAYISQNVTVDKKLKTVSFDESSEGLAYIIYK